MVAVFSLPLSFKLKEKHNSPSSEFGGSSRQCQQNQRTVEALGAAWHIHRLSGSSAPNPAQPPAERPFGILLPVPRTHAVCTLCCSPRPRAGAGIAPGPRGPFLPSNAPSLSPVLQMFFFSASTGH